MFSLEDCRAFYAREIKFAATVATPGLVEAYARVPREKFLGPAPWQVSSPAARALLGDTAQVKTAYRNEVRESRRFCASEHL